MRRQLRRVGLLAWVLLTALETGLTTVHAHEAPGAAGLRAAPVPDSGGGSGPGGRHEDGACTVCKGLLQTRDLQPAQGFAAPPTAAAAFLRVAGAERRLLPIPPLSPRDPRAPPSSS
jgi:hypothetical protein